MTASVVLGCVSRGNQDEAEETEGLCRVEEAGWVEEQLLAAAAIRRRHPYSIRETAQATVAAIYLELCSSLVVAPSLLEDRSAGWHNVVSIRIPFVDTTDSEDSPSCRRLISTLLSIRSAKRLENQPWKVALGRWAL